MEEQRGSTFSLTSVLDGSGWSTPRLGLFTTRTESRYAVHMKLDGPQDGSGQVRRISPCPGFDLRTFQPVASSCPGELFTCHVDNRSKVPCNSIFPPSIAFSDVTPRSRHRCSRILSSVRWMEFSTEEPTRDFSFLRLGALMTHGVTCPAMSAGALPVPLKGVCVRIVSKIVFWKNHGYDTATNAHFKKSD
jgi:hypothetical protein